jgi:hypothetical protein
MRLHDEITADYNDMIYAATREEIEGRRKVFIRKWRLKHRAVADSLEEAGERLFAFAGADTVVIIDEFAKFKCRIVSLVETGQIRAARALLRWRAQDLAGEASVGIATIRRAELTDSETSMTQRTTSRSAARSRPPASSSSMRTEVGPAFVFASRTNRSSAKIYCFCPRA